VILYHCCQQLLQVPATHHIGLAAVGVRDSPGDLKAQRCDSMTMWGGSGLGFVKSDIRGGWRRGCAQ
jgi:hypothetical protein